MKENEYKANEKVLLETRGKLLGKKPEEVYCFFTEGLIILLRTYT
jgi:hypothetical protein